MSDAWGCTTKPDRGEVQTIEQIHSNIIIQSNQLGPGDGIFFDSFSDTVGIRTADCVPLGIVEQGRAVLLHGSRKSLLAGLLDAVPTFLEPSRSTYIYIGPHICADHFMFEWEGKEIAEFQKKFPAATENRDGIIHLSLRQAIEQYFQEWKVDCPVYEDGRCTFEGPSLPSRKRWLADGKPGRLTHLVTTLTPSREQL